MSQSGHSALTAMTHGYGTHAPLDYRTEQVHYQFLEQTAYKWTDRLLGFGQI